MRAELVVRDFLEPGNLLVLRQVDDLVDHHPALERFDGGLVKRADAADHPVGLLEGARRVHVAERALLQEVLADHFAGLDDEALLVLERVGADELDDLLEAGLAGEDRADPGALVGEVLGDVLAVPGVQEALVQAVGPVPVDRREVPAVRQLRVQRPEGAHDPERALRHRLREVAAGRAHGADDRHRPHPLVLAEHDRPAGPLVEGGEPAGQVRRVALLRRHFLKAGGDLAQRLGPAARGVGHQRHPVAHVAEVLRHRHAGVDAGLARRDRHVGGVGDEDRPLHQRPAVARVLQFGELGEHIRHLVPPLPAADVHDDVGVRPLGEGLLHDGLPAAEGPGHRRGPPHRHREEDVQDPLAGHEQFSRLQLALRRPGDAHRPGLHHPQLPAPAQPGHDIGDGHVPAPDLDHLVLGGIRRHHHAVRVRVLLDLAEDVSRADAVPLLDLGDERPLPSPVERVDDDAARDEVPLRVPDLVQRALDAVVDTAEHAGAEFEREGRAGRLHRLAEVQPGGVLVHLDERRLAVEADDLADQLLFADADDVVHPRAGQAPRDDRRAGDAGDFPSRSCHVSVLSRARGSTQSATSASRQTRCAPSPAARCRPRRIPILRAPGAAARPPAGRGPAGFARGHRRCPGADPR